MSNSARLDEVMDWLESNKRLIKNRYIIKYNSKVLCFGNKANNMYVSHERAIEAAVRHLYTDRATIDEAMQKGIITIEQI